MKLDTVLFFSEQTCNDRNLILCYSLQKKNVTVFWNPDMQEFTEYSPPSTLIVTDTDCGIQFAKQHQIPYIQKWTDELETNEPKPICYYDKTESLSYEYLVNQWKRANHLPWTIAETSRTTLRELTVEDIPALYALRSNPSIVSFLPELDSLETELEKHKNYIKYQYAFFDYGLWGIFLKNGILIGQAGIQNIEYQDETALELSYLIAPEHQRKGFATEVLLSILHYVSSSLEINKLIAIIAKNNLPSIRTARKLGFLCAEAVTHFGYDCNYYVLDNIKTALSDYQLEQKRINAAQSAYRNAQKHPVQQVYSRYWNK